MSLFAEHACVHAGDLVAEAVHCLLELRVDVCLFLGGLLLHYLNGFKNLEGLLFLQTGALLRDSYLGAVERL